MPPGKTTSEVYLAPPRCYNSFMGNLNGMIKALDDKLAGMGLGFLGSLIDIALIFALAFLIVRITKGIVRRLIKKRGGAEESVRRRRMDTAGTLAISVVRYIAYFVAVAATIGELGLSDTMTSILAAAGIGGVIIGIGAQSLISDIVNGFFMLFEDQYAVGDYISAGGATGTVEAIALRTTTIRSYTGELTTIPNGSIKGVTNYSRTDSLALIDMPIAYGEDAGRALALMEEEARAYKAELGDAAPGEPEALGAVSAEGGAMALRLVMRVKPLEHWGVQRELTRRIAARFVKEGIRLPYTRVSIAEDEK